MDKTLSSKYYVMSFPIKGLIMSDTYDYVFYEINCNPLLTYLFIIQQWVEMMVTMSNIPQKIACIHVFPQKHCMTATIARLQDTSEFHQYRYDSEYKSPTK